MRVRDFVESVTDGRFVHYVAFVHYCSYDLISVFMRLRDSC